jgi:hypothetical protein
MICPQCGKRNELGIQRCRFCRRVFTRSASRPRAVSPPSTWHDARISAQQGFDPRPPDRRQPPTWDEEPAWESDTPFPEQPVAREPRRQSLASYSDGPINSQRRPARAGCLLAFGITSVLLVGGIVLLVLASTFVVQPMIRDAAVAQISTGVRDEVTRQIDSQIGDSLSGNIVISEDEINQRLATGIELGPISGASVQITPEGLVIRLRAYGVDGTYRAQVLDQNGSIAIVGSPMEGPLSYVMPEGDLENAVNAELAAALSDAGYFVEQVAVADGTITLTLSQ